MLTYLCNKADLDYQCVSIGKNTTAGYIVNFHEMMNY